MSSRQTSVNQTRAVDPATPNSVTHVSGGLRKAKTGNQASMRLVREMLVQRKLSVSRPGDRFEVEADRIADSVMRMAQPTTTPAIQRMCSGCDEELQRKELASVRESESIQSSQTHEAATVQRMCDDCEDETRAAVENIEDVEDERVLAKQADSSSPGPTSIESSALNTLAGGGHPLPLSTRSFFEGRMGRDFRGVRVHSDTHADELARSVDARAFTHSNHLVFRFGEYQPDSAAGRHLLAHELAHTIQQGASPSAALHRSALDTPIQRQPNPGSSLVPEIQRICEVTAPPGDMTCPQAIDTVGSGTPIMFGQDSFTIAPAALPTLSSIAAAWHAGGRSQFLRIDGFASCDGPPALNWRLSCNRARAVRAELEHPTDGSPGVDPAFIEIAANGETEIFSPTSLTQNRRVTVSSGGTPPPGPRCALTITGPDEVDHYCAAYVPSDAAACGVFPAPTITLAVAGAAAGATLTWRISRGNTSASIVGAITGPSVTIQGDAPSVAQGDVTAQVTDGTCTTTHALTVREPSSLTAADAPVTTPVSIRNTITYTVRDQFGNPMGANICIDETVTVCSDNHPELGAFRFGDAGTRPGGLATDNLFTPLPTTPPPLCTKLDQVLTAGGCGPLLHNTLLFQPAGVTLNQNDSCVAGGACP